MGKQNKYILHFNQIRKQDIAYVGGKNSALGEMFNRLGKMGIPVPDGFAVTARAYFDFIKNAKIDRPIADILKGLNTDDTADLQKRGEQIRGLIVNAEYSLKLKLEIIKAYQQLQSRAKGKISLAVRSSATAEDLPVASFAGQLESYLNISGESELLVYIKNCFASLFTDRAISYRQNNRFPLFKVAVSVGVQRMVRSDLAGAGVMFTLDTESGFRDLVVINASWGLGENVVKGRVAPDEYAVFKTTLRKGFRPIVKKALGRKEMTLVFGENTPTKNVSTQKEDRLRFVLTDKEILHLADWGMKIEKYFGRPMDIEWAKDGQDGKLYIVQARPETVHAGDKGRVIHEYSLPAKGKILLTGVAVGNHVGAGKIKVVASLNEIAKFKEGDVLVAKITDPAWEPIMKKASAIVTDSGGRTCHAAIVSRELGVPCIVGARTATKDLQDGTDATVSCAEGEVGFVYEGILPIVKKEIHLDNLKLPKVPEIKMIIGNPANAFNNSFLPNRGVGLAREEFIFTDYIKVHPMAIARYEELPDNIKMKVDEVTAGYERADFIVDKLAEGVGQIAAAFYPKEILVRFSDFKTNEYRELLGGKLFEPEESNPMLGFRGASRYESAEYKEAFLYEIRALKKAIEIFGLDNIGVMVPFCRNVKELASLVKLLARNGLKRSKKFKIYLTCELPVNVISAKEFLTHVDGFSIGSNDLTQLTLGVDRDSAIVSHLYNELDPAVLSLIKQVIVSCKKARKKIGLCGQAPSDFPEFARFLLKNKIDSLSLNPDSIVKVLKQLAKSKK